MRQARQARSGVGVWGVEAASGPKVANGGVGREEPN